MKTFRVILCTEKPGAVVNAIDIKADDFSLSTVEKKVYFTVNTEQPPVVESIAYFNLEKIYGFFDVDYMAKTTRGLNSNDDICANCHNLDDCFLFPNKCEIHKLKECKK